MAGGGEEEKKLCGGCVGEVVVGPGIIIIIGRIFCLSQFLTIVE